MTRPVPRNTTSEVDRLGHEVDTADTVEPDDLADATGEPPHRDSVTGVVAEALQTGILPDRADELIPGEDAVLQAGDPDADVLNNEFSGEELPGGSMSTPDQNNVDEIGDVYGVPEHRGDLQLGDDLIAPRDRDRWELNPDSRDKNK